jgi:hypothetical protein
MRIKISVLLYISRCFRISQFIALIVSRFDKCQIGLHSSRSPSFFIVFTSPLSVMSPRTRFKTLILHTACELALQSRYDVCSSLPRHFSCWMIICVVLTNYLHPALHTCMKWNSGTTIKAGPRQLQRWRFPGHTKLDTHTPCSSPPSQWSALRRGRYLYNKHKKWIPIPSAGFEPVISAIEGPLYASTSLRQSKRHKATYHKTLAFPARFRGSVEITADEMCSAQCKISVNQCSW